MPQSSPQHASLNNGGRHRSISLRSRRRSIPHLQMLRSKVTLHPAAPASHKRKIQRAANGRAGQRNQSPHPLFSSFGANLRSEAFRDARSEFFENLFFSQILPVVDARGRGRRLPHLNSLVVAAASGIDYGKDLKNRFSKNSLRASRNASLRRL